MQYIEKIVGNNNKVITCSLDRSFNLDTFKYFVRDTDSKKLLELSFNQLDFDILGFYETTIVAFNKYDLQLKSVLRRVGQSYCESMPDCYARGISSYEDLLVNRIGIMYNSYENVYRILWDCLLSDCIACTYIQGLLSVVFRDLRNKLQFFRLDFEILDYERFVMLLAKYKIVGALEILKYD